MPFGRVKAQFRPVLGRPRAREPAQKVTIEHGSLHAKYQPDWCLLYPFRDHFWFRPNADFGFCRKIFVRYGLGCVIEGNKKNLAHRESAYKENRVQGIFLLQFWVIARGGFCAPFFQNLGLSYRLNTGMAGWRGLFVQDP